MLKSFLWNDLHNKIMEAMLRSIILTLPFLPAQEYFGAVNVSGYADQPAASILETLMCATSGYLFLHFLRYLKIQHWCIFIITFNIGLFVMMCYQVLIFFQFPSNRLQLFLRGDPLEFSRSQHYWTFLMFILNVSFVLFHTTALKLSSCMPMMPRDLWKKLQLFLLSFFFF